MYSDFVRGNTTTQAINMEKTNIALFVNSYSIYLYPQSQICFVIMFVSSFILWFLSRSMYLMYKIFYKPLQK